MPTRSPIVDRDRLRPARNWGWRLVRAQLARVASGLRARSAGAWRRALGRSQRQAVQWLRFHSRPALWVAAHRFAHARGVLVLGRSTRRMRCDSQQPNSPTAQRRPRTDTELSSADFRAAEY